MAREIFGGVVERRIMVLQGVIGDEHPREFRKAVALFARGGNDPVRFYINSAGGDALAALEMIGIMKAAPFPIDCIGFGQVASAAFVLMQGGRDTYAVPPVTFRFHRAHSHSVVGGGMREYLKVIDLLYVIDGAMLSHFFGHGDPREVLPLFLEEATISVQRAKSIGIIRGTVSPRELRAAIRKIIRTAE